jgi:hypothetical protein
MISNLNIRYLYEIPTYRHCSCRTNVNEVFVSLKNILREDLMWLDSKKYRFIRKRKDTRNI